MKIYLSEKIGAPELFTGRKRELKEILQWAENIKKRFSKSTAILSRRKTGKSALLQRLYNIIFHQNNGLIPFYYEIQEAPIWLGSFAKDFFLSFISQYIAFKTRETDYINYRIESFDLARELSIKNGMKYLIRIIDNIELHITDDDTRILWEAAREAPRRIASLQDESIVQIIDEFQYMGKMVYIDKELKIPFTGMAGTYFHTAEYKNAPLLISGSFVGWLMQELGRFKKVFLENMSPKEAAEMIFNYSSLLGVPVSENIVPLICDVTGGSPFYISSLFYSAYKDKDLTKEQGLLKTLEFEMTDNRGDIRNTWMEYIHYAFKAINGMEPMTAKNIVLYLCKNKERPVSRKEIRDELKIDWSDSKLEERMEILILNDIIEQGTSNFYYQGIKDHIFDRVFRAKYADEIEKFDPKKIISSYKALFEDSKRKYASLQGKYNSLKGRYGEYRVIDRLKFKAYKDSDYYFSITQNLPPDFKFVEYKSVWKYSGSVTYGRNFEIDLFAKADKDKYSLIGEVKNRIGKFDLTEAETFLSKAKELIRLEYIEKSVFFVLCVGGFTDDAVKFFKSNSIAWSDSEGWLER